MLFASAALFALMMGGHSKPPPTRLPTLPPEMWIRQASVETDYKKDLIRKLPVEVKGIKVVGASGFGIFFPIMPDVSVGAGVTAFKISPTERATQIVGAIRFRF